MTIVDHKMDTLVQRLALIVTLYDRGPKHMVMQSGVPVFIERVCNAKSLIQLTDPEFFGTRVGCHVSAVEWV